MPRAPAVLKRFWLSSTWVITMIAMYAVKPTSGSRWQSHSCCCICSCSSMCWSYTIVVQHICYMSKCNAPQWCSSSTCCASSSTAAACRDIRVNVAPCSCRAGPQLTAQCVLVDTAAAWLQITATCQHGADWHVYCKAATLQVDVPTSTMLTIDLAVPGVTALAKASRPFSMVAAACMHTHSNSQPK